MRSFGRFVLISAVGVMLSVFSLVSFVIGDAIYYHYAGHSLVVGSIVDAARHLER